jgi:hypothetical protein
MEQERKNELCLLYLGLTYELGIPPHLFKARRSILGFLVTYKLLNTVEAQLLLSSFSYWVKTQQKAGTLPCAGLTSSPALIELAFRIREVFNVGPNAPLSSLIFLQDTKVFFNITVGGLSNPMSTVAKASPGFNFSAFKTYFPTLHPENFPLPSDAFLAWLIGFSEVADSSKQWVFSCD